MEVMPRIFCVLGCFLNSYTTVYVELIGKSFEDNLALLTGHNGVICNPSTQKAEAEKGGSASDNMRSIWGT